MYMLKRSAFCFLLVLAVGQQTLVGADDLLPGEGGDKAAVGHHPFPSRMHAFIWRNWSLVPRERLAEVLKSDAENLSRVATSMGLPPQGAVLPEWREQGYITVLRRNWHLLPYDQLLTLLGMDRARLRYCLDEDDFLFVKLGRVKPACEPLLFHEPSKEESRAAAQLARWLEEEGVGDALKDSGEPRFAFVKELSRPDPNLVVKTASDQSPFELRYLFSYFADYGDPLIDPEVKSYPEGLMQRLGAAGVNGVWVHTVLRTLARDPAFPEFGEGCEKRMAGLRTLVSRAKKYGIDIYLYMNEPRTMPASFFDTKPEREAMKGVPMGDNIRLCTSHPEVRRWMGDALTTVFKEVPGLGGIFTITASENATSCASHRQQKKCPRCGERAYAEIIAEVNSTLAQGVWRANPDAKVIVWDWVWDDQYAADIIAGLPAKCWLQSVSERSLEIERGGVKHATREYSISAVGPGPRAKKHWGLAKEHGLRAIAKVQVGVTWELASVPYVPAMDLVAEHALNLVAAGVDGVMLSWSLGCYPSPNLEVFQSFGKGDTEIGPALDKVAKHHYGADHVAQVRQAWSAFSTGYREYPFHIGTVYTGPQHMGPANPLWIEPTGYSATMVGIPYDDLKRWVAIYPPKIWIAQMEKVRIGFEQGCGMWEGMVREMKAGSRERIAAERDLKLFRAAEWHFASCVNQARFVMARESQPGEGAEEVAARRREMRGIAGEELAVTKKLLPLVLADSRIGYESSNHYFYVPQDLVEKVLCCRWVMSQLER